MKEKTFSLIKKTLKHELISGSTYIFVGSIIGNILAFIFNLFVVRKLSNSDYGTYASIISLITLSTIPALSFTTIIVQFATNYLSKNEDEKAAMFYKLSSGFVFVIATVFFLGFLIFNPFLQSFLRVSHPLLIIIAGFTVAFSYISVVNTGYAQSLLKFRFMSFYQVLTGLVKVVMGIVFVTLGYRVFGALWAVCFSFLIPFFFAFIPVRHIVKQHTKSITISLKEVVSYSLPAMLTTFALSSFTSTDILLTKHFFNPDLAGAYAKLSIIGRVIFYFTSPIPMVMFPLVIKRYNQKQNFQNLFYLSLLIIAVPSFGITAFYYLFPSFTAAIFLGTNNHFRYTYDLWIMGLFLSIFSILNVLVTFFLSLKKTQVMYFAVIGAALQAIGIIFFHKTIIQVILSSLITSVVLLIGLLLYYFRTYVKNTA